MARKRTKKPKRTTPIRPQIENLEAIDAYEQFFDILPKEKFFKFGLDNIITIEERYANEEWKALLSRIKNRADNLYIRNFGSYGNKSVEMKKLYRKVFGIKDINIDRNGEPTRVLQKLTGRRKDTNSANIFNYQVSHVFGRTRNVYCFAAPWNIVFIPKILDPLTGHEAKGDYVEEFQKLFRRRIIEKFRPAIQEYNREIRKMRPKIEDWVNKNVKEGKENFLKDFEEIDVNE